MDSFRKTRQGGCGSTNCNSRGTDDDLSVQNGEIFVGLRRLGKEVTSLEYAHEGHILETPANIVDFWERTLEFLDTHLGVSANK